MWSLTTSQAHPMPLSCHSMYWKELGQSWKTVLHSRHAIALWSLHVWGVCKVLSPSANRVRMLFSTLMDHHISPFLPCPWDFPSRNTEWLLLLSGDLVNPGMDRTLHWQADSYHWETWEASLSEVVMSIADRESILALMTWFYFQLRVKLSLNFSCEIAVDFPRHESHSRVVQFFVLSKMSHSGRTVTCSYWHPDQTTSSI